MPGRRTRHGAIATSRALVTRKVGMFLSGFGSTVSRVAKTLDQAAPFHARPLTSHYKALSTAWCCKTAPARSGVPGDGKKESVAPPSGSASSPVSGA